MLAVEGRRRRQERMLEQMRAVNADVFVTADVRSAYCFTGSFAAEGSPAIFALWQDGTTLLVTSAEAEALASEMRIVETYSIQRSITQPMHDAVRLFADAMHGRPARRAAVERSATPCMLEQHFAGASILDATETVLRLRKQKEPDEIEEIRRSLWLCAVAYGAARKALHQGKRN
jgi:Xaa-Pro aminopeptidase